MFYCDESFEQNLLEISFPNSTELIGGMCEPIQLSENQWKLNDLNVKGMKWLDYNAIFASMEKLGQYVRKERLILELFQHLLAVHSDPENSGMGALAPLPIKM